MDEFPVAFSNRFLSALLVESPVEIAVFLLAHFVQEGRDHREAIVFGVGFDLGEFAECRQDAQKAAMWFEVVPGLITPGQRAINGTRTDC